jgi:hypothetical protein
LISAMETSKLFGQPLPLQQHLRHDYHARISVIGTTKAEIYR